MVPTRNVSRFVVALVLSVSALFGQAGNAGYGVGGGGNGTGSYTFSAPLSLSGSTVSLGASGVTSGAYTCLNATINTQGIITTATSGSCAGGGGTWGSITGTLSAQTDLQTALNAKQNTITVLPVANGGNGTATPAITAGSNVTLTGSWPNYTISSTGGSGAGVATGTTLPATCTPGPDTLFYKTGAGTFPNQALYTCSGIDTWTQSELLGGTGALSVNSTTGALDIVTTVVPRLGAANAFTGRNSEDGPTDFKIQAAPASPALGYLTLYANTDGSFHVKNNAGTDTAIGGGGAGTTVAANGPYLDIAGVHYIASHMVTPVLMNNSGFASSLGSPTYTAGLAPTLSGPGGINTYTAPMPSNGIFHVAMNCTLPSNSGCGIAAEEGTAGSGIQLFCGVFFNETGNSPPFPTATSVACIKYQNGAFSSTPFVSFPGVANPNDLWLGFEYNPSSQGTNFVMSGDGGRTWGYLWGFPKFNVFNTAPTSLGFGLLTGSGGPPVVSILHMDRN